ncbi:hypothetical protein ACFL2V_03265 [Pseudomonadota bacterium]
MSKFSIFTSFISAILIIVVAEVLVHDYLNYSDISENVSASVVNAQTSTPDIPEPEPEEDLDPIITYEMLSGAGHSGLSLQRVPFNGILFKTIDLRDLDTIPVVSQNLLEQNQKKLGILNEIRSESEPLAEEIYSLLKDKGSLLLDAGINVTDDMGDSSFFINFNDDPGSTFLVVKKGNNVYALTYEKSFHPLLETVVQLLP